MFQVGDNPNCRVLGVDIIQASTGTWQLAIKFADDAFEEMTAYLSLTERAMGNTNKALGVLGFDPATDDYANIEGENSTLIGKTATCVCANETYKGVTRLKIKWINSADGPQRKEVDQGEKDRMLARLKTTYGGGAPAKPEAFPVHTPVDAGFQGGAPEPESDIPFV